METETKPNYIETRLQTLSQEEGSSIPQALIIGNIRLKKNLLGLLDVSDLCLDEMDEGTRALWVERLGEFGVGESFALQKHSRPDLELLLSWEEDYPRFVKLLLKVCHEMKIKSSLYAKASPNRMVTMGSGKNHVTFMTKDDNTIEFDVVYGAEILEVRGPFPKGEDENSSGLEWEKLIATRNEKLVWNRATREMEYLSRPQFGINGYVSILNDHPEIMTGFQQLMKPIIGKEKSEAIVLTGWKRFF